MAPPSQRLEPPANPRTQAISHRSMRVRGRMRCSTASSPHCRRVEKLRPSRDAELKWKGADPSLGTALMIGKPTDGRLLVSLG